jgi:hypothetical protein
MFVLVVSHVARDTNGSIIVEISVHLEVRFIALIFPAGSRCLTSVALLRIGIIHVMPIIAGLTFLAVSSQH